ncbi:MAG: type VII secretion protein EccB, partial [Actinocrinis sp.]
TIGAPYGIGGAPPDVPSAGSVDITQWTLCMQSKKGQQQGDSGRQTVLEIGYGQGADDKVPSSTAFVVHDSSHTNYLVAGDTAYKVKNNLAITAFNSQVSASNPWVSDAWLKAFHQGADLVFPTVDGFGDSLPGGLPSQPGTHVGDYGKVSTSSGQVTGYIETKHGLISVNSFVYQLFTSQPALANSSVKELKTLTAADVNAAQADNEQTDAGKSLTGAGGDWPRNLPTIVDADGQEGQYAVLCTSFSGAYDGNDPHLDMYNGPGLPQKLDNGAGIVQTGGDNLADIVFVEPGHGAMARDISGGANLTNGAVYLVTDTGQRYEMTTNATVTGPDGKAAQTSAIKQLQYGNVPIKPVPDNWMQLVQQGAQLDPTLAGTTPQVNQ